MRAAGTAPPAGAPRVRAPLAGVLLAVPLAVALLGPLVAGSTASVAAPALPPSAAHPLGTDVLGRDVLALVLSGGVSVVGMTVAALVLSYLVGIPLGLLAAQGRWLTDQAVMRSLDVVLVFPGLLVLTALAATGRRDAVTLVVAIALLQLPWVARLVRVAALAPGCRAAVEAMRLQGRSWWHVQIGYVARAALGPVVTDSGTRIALVLYLLASVNFLGLGLPGSAPDWAVLIERNSPALFTQPVVVLVPAGLLMALCVGTNLVADRLLARGREPR